MIKQVIHKTGSWMVGLLCVAETTLGATEYITPLGGSNKVDWAIINFMDHDPATNVWRDYQGGLHAYDGHDGIDFFLYDFKTMDDGIDVYAAAPGVVGYITDGYADNRGPYPDPVWTYRVNMVYIQHADGALSSYAHLKYNTIAVTTGQYVARGQKIGQVGSSGSTAEPHLHFQVEYDGQCREIITNDGGQTAVFPWYDSYSNQVVRQVVSMGVTITNDVALTSEYANLFWKQTPCTYSVIHSGAFCVWLKCVGFSPDDTLAARLVPLAPDGQLLDFSDMAWNNVSQYCRAFSGYWYSRWISPSLVDGETYKFQYRFNDEDWRDGPGANTFSVDDSCYEVYLSRYSPGYANAPLAPAFVEATDGPRTRSVRLTWAEATNAIHYVIYRSLTNDSASATRIVATSNTGYDDTNATAGATYYYWVKAVNAAGASSFSASDSGFLGVVGPLITANGLVGDVNLNTDDPVSIAVQMMNIDSYLGVEADWWVVALAGSSWFYLDSAVGWTQEGAWRPVYQGVLGNLPATEVLNMSGLSTGSYMFYFAVDYPMDGILNLDGPILVDAVNVIVQ